MVVRRFVLAVIFLLLLGNLSLASLTSVIPSSVQGIDIPNTHVVISRQHPGSGTILRGMAPTCMPDLDQLKSFGVTDVLIFKNETKNEVRLEQMGLAKSGLTQLGHISFPWKDIKSFSPACEMSIQAMQLLIDSYAKGRTSFFHCTVGEDRTGYLAGLLTIWLQGRNVEEVFTNEMCERGYGSGNPRKPKFGVVDKINQSLTPLFLKMAYRLAEARAKGCELSSQLCALDPAQDANFNSSLYNKTQRFECQPSRYAR